MRAFTALFLCCAPVTAVAQPLAGTKPLQRDDDLAMEMVAGIDRYLMRETEAAAGKRGTPSRAGLARVYGVVDARVPNPQPQNIDGRVRWPVLDGLWAEGIVLKPNGRRKGKTIVLPDPDASDVPEARRRADAGDEVLVIVLIDRRDTWSGNPSVRMTNQPHREWIHRQLFPAGRHIIGIEVQKVLSAIDWFAAGEDVSLAGYGEGGLVAMVAAALDDRITRTLISGAFEPRENVWRQPIYRSVWGQLLAHGDAEIVRLIAPREVRIEPAGYPAIQGPSPEREGRRGAAPGNLAPPDAADVLREFERIGTANARMAPALSTQAVPGPPLDLSIDQQTAVEEMTAFAQRLIRESERTRREFAAGKDAASLRKYLWEEVLGKLPAPTEPMEVETRAAYDKPAFRGYEAVIPVWRDVFAYGVLLVPKDLKPGERRPVVVAQHGLNGRPQYLIDPPDARNETVYARYAAKLAERGFIVYVPQNPYIGDEQFRVLLRKAPPLKLSLFSFIIGQHQRTLEWLATLPFVDPKRIGFYGLSYGGKTAMRVPSLLDGYALSICSGDFNEWVWKITSVTEPFSYMFTQEYDMLEWNLANTLSYSEMAGLIAPRPFMVERGHRDPVGLDEWVAYEYAKVRRAYDEAGIGERTAIEFFNGVHQIHGRGTFDFLHRHLGWPKRD